MWALSAPTPTFLYLIMLSCSRLIGDEIAMVTVKDGVMLLACT